MTNEQLELLVALASNYNTALVQEKEAGKAKTAASDQIKELLVQTGTKEIKAGGFDIALTTRATEHINTKLAQEVLSKAQYEQLVTVKASVVLRVTPSRG